MDQDKVVRLDITEAQSCSTQEKTWNEVLLELHTTQVQIIFTSVKAFLNAAPEIQEKLRSQLRIPSSFFDRMFLQSNGFSGYDVWLCQNEEIEAYSEFWLASSGKLLEVAQWDLAYWSRFSIKQTYDTLKPKRTFTPHTSNHHAGSNDWNAEIAIHGPQSARYGWEWYEMGFFACWKRSGLTTFVCFDLPEKMQSTIQSISSSTTIDISSPYAVFLLASDALLRLYDDSVWSIRNHISQWEARRSQEADYSLLHEIARHGVHVRETLNVAIRSLDAIRQDHERFRTNAGLSRGNSQQGRWDQTERGFEFQVRFLQGLLERSKANNARVQNEITLAFNTAAQGDSKVQVRIGEESKSEASAMKAIAVVTMAFLPATFVSTLFGMNFFSFQPDELAHKPSFVVSRHFWIFWAFSIPMTVATLALWFWWSRWAHLGLSSVKAKTLRET